jgi:4'-phosphopantetheinyl transferase
MNLYWLEQAEADVPAEDDWLSPGEALRLSGMRFARRRADWRLGRWTAKRAVAAYLNLAHDPQALMDVEILPAPSGAPEAFLRGEPVEVAISLSHRDGSAACAVAPAPVALGCDLEIVEPRSDAFIADYFTTEEQSLVARAPAADRFRLAALVWSGKESVLKALCTGLRVDTRCVTVNPVDGPRRGGAGDSWRPLLARHTGGETFHGWWRHTGNLLRTVVAAPPAAPPILLAL